MKKYIKLLVENLFDDLYDIDQEDDVTLQIANKIYVKSKEELRNEIKEQLELQGPDADLNMIDTHSVTDMSYLFRGLDIRTIKIDKWDVSNVTNMSLMFAFSEKFTGNGLENWDVSKVKDMSHMFYGCYNFNSDLSQWDVSNVTNMRYMFNDCRQFNCNLSNWNVGKVKDMSYMFSHCHNFKGKGLENWDVSHVRNMTGMFEFCKNFTGEGLKFWDVSNVKDMHSMFVYCHIFNSDLSQWDVSHVTYMSYMFYGCYKFRGKGLENWNVSNVNVIDMEKMFFYCKKLIKPLWFKY